MSNRYTVRERLSYWFDNRMAQGTVAKIRLLLVGTLIFVLVVGTLAAIARGSVEEYAQWSIFKTLMYVLGKGTLDGSEGSPIYVALMLATILYCMFFTAILIGLINNGIRDKMDQLAKGRTRVLEQGHTLILGYNDATFVLLEELIRANRNAEKPQCIVVLGEEGYQTMVDEINHRLGRQKSHPNTRIICRSGSVYDYDDLARCSIEACKSVVVNGDNDFDAVRTIIACAIALGRAKDDAADPYIVSVIRGDQNMVEASVAAANAGYDGKIAFMSLNQTLARILVHTSRQPGLSDVFTELFNYSGHEFYVVSSDPSFSRLRGKTIAEINQLLKSSFAVGISNERTGVIIDDPRTVVFGEGDSLIVIEEDDNDLLVFSGERNPEEVQPAGSTDNDEVDLLIIGIKPILNQALTEYANYLRRGATIHIADSIDNSNSVIDDSVRALLNDCGINLVVHNTDVDERRELEDLLEECNPEGVLVLIGNGAPSAKKADEQTMRILLLLRDYRYRTGKTFSITSEIRQPANKKLVAAAGPDDFIIGSHIAALLMAQISQTWAMSSLFAELLSSVGYEIYMKKAARYVCTDRPVSLFSASKAVADQSEILIGIRQKVDGAYRPVVVNPAKVESDMVTEKLYAFGDDDYFVVLASN